MGTKKIMIVEDETISLALMRRLLETEGYTVVSTQDGSAAVSLAMRERPDLIILDLGLPGSDPFSPTFDGFIIIDWLHRMAAGVKTPIIVITAQTGANVRQRALEAGATAFFAKPPHRDEVLSAIRTALGEDSIV
ncbi:MAG: response regulator [Verrucomicrobia bacterium]|nr:response regulator [Verrucomicrobiota bacterium]